MLSMRVILPVLPSGENMLFCPLGKYPKFFTPKHSVPMNLGKELKNNLTGHDGNSCHSSGLI